MQAVFEAHIWLTSASSSVLFAIKLFHGFFFSIFFPGAHNVKGSLNRFLKILFFLFGCSLLIFFCFHIYLLIFFLYQFNDYSKQMNAIGKKEIQHMCRSG